MGVASEELMDRIIETLKILGAKRAMVVHGQGMDEISTLGKTRICRLDGDKITSAELDPADLGIAATNIDELRTGDVEANAQIVRDILEGRDAGPRRDIVVLNAAAGIIVAGLADDFAPAMTKAEEAISSGKASAALAKLVEVSNG